jgi:nucleotide-binding universal stress UspA family protein
MKSILVHANRDPGMNARLETALAIARAQRGHVTLLIDTPINRFVSADPYGGVVVASGAIQQALADDDLLAAEVLERLTGEDVPYDVVQYEIEPIAALAGAARLADLIVVSRDCGFAGDLALEARIPVLALAADAILPAPLSSVSIAWDGSAEAAAAVRAAIPLLRDAGQVDVLTVNKDTSRFPGTEVLSYLSRHGIKAELAELESNGSVEESLLAAAAERKAQLLVMGAFGHSRLRELLIGGVTRFFLNEAEGPALLLAH